MERSFAFEPDTAPAFWLVETLWTVLASGIQTENRLGFMEQIMGAGLGPPTHRHPHACEGFYILEGTCTFNVLGKSVEAGPGTFVHLPRLLPHSFSVDSTEARVLNFYNPACFEVMIMACGRLAPERRRPTMPESAAPESDDQLRMLSRLYGQEAVTALPFLQPPAADLMRTEESDHEIGEPVIITAADVQSQHLFGMEWHRLINLNQTGNTHEIFEVIGDTDAGQPNVSEGAAQAVYILEGSISVEIAGDRQTLAAGAFAYLKSGEGARWRLREPSRLLILNIAE